MSTKTVSSDLIKHKGITASLPASLPVTRSLTLVYGLSLLIVLLITAASLAGLLYRSDIYPTEDLLLSFFPNDVINLVIVLPILLLSMWLARRGKLIGLLFWPGALLNVTYTYVAYLFGMPFNVLFLPYLFLVVLSAYTTIGLVTCIDKDAVQQRLAGLVPVKFAGGALAVLSVLFTMRVIGLVIIALANQTVVDPREYPVLVADLSVIPAWFAGGVLLWRRRALGYVAGVGLLFQSGMSFIGLILFLVIQPLLTTAPISVVDIVLTLILALPCLVPLGLFIRGAVSRRGSSPA